MPKKGSKNMEKLRLYGYKIAGGNSTLLVEGCPMDQRESFARKQLVRFEQVGFVETTVPESENEPDLPAAMTMMGGELSINGTLAFARFLAQRNRALNRGELRTSGLNSLVKFTSNGEVSATFKMKPKVIEEAGIVLFEGIGYVCVENPGPPNDQILRDLANKYDLPAFGIAGYTGNSLTPYVYVRDTDSLVPETACGSGSIALYLITGQPNIVQWTGQRINILRRGDQFTVRAKVTEMKKIK